MPQQIDQIDKNLLEELQNNAAQSRRSGGAADAFVVR